MMRPLIASAALVAVLAAGCGSSSSQDPKPTVSDLIASFETAYQAKDAAAVAELCVYPFSLDGAPIDSAATLQAYLQASFEAAGDYEVVELVDPQIAEEGDTVTVTGSFHVIDATYGESTTAVTITGVRVNGAWKAASFSREP